MSSSQPQQQPPQRSDVHISPIVISSTVVAAAAAAVNTESATIPTSAAPARLNNKTVAAHQQQSYSRSSQAHVNMNTNPDGPPPTIVVGRRQRKKPRVFETTPSPFSRKPAAAPPSLSAGTGLKLSSIPNIAYSLDKVNLKDPIIELLHRVLFNSQGQTSKRKVNIRAFSGFSPAETHRANGDVVTDRTRAREKLLKVHYNIVRRIANILDVPIPQIVRTVPIRPRLPLSSPMDNNPARYPSSSTGNDHDDSLSSQAKKRSRSRSTVDDDDGDGNVSMGDDRETEADAEEHDHLKNVRADDHRQDDEENLQHSPSAVQERKSRYAALRDEQRRMKEVVIDAILNFLDSPSLLPGRINIAKRDKEQRAKRRAMERERKAAEIANQGDTDNDDGHDNDDHYVPKKKAKTTSDDEHDVVADALSKPRNKSGRDKQRRNDSCDDDIIIKMGHSAVDVDGKLAARSKGPGESDEDGDEDLERDALPWIELMQQDNRTLCALSSSSCGDQDGETVADEHV